MKIMGVDPGGTTGIAIIDVPWDESRYEPSPDDAFVASMQLEPNWGSKRDSIAHRIERLLIDERVDLLAVEKFIITQQTVRFTRQPDALWIIGGCRFLGDLYDVPVHLQPASLAKTTWDATRLKETGWAKAVKQKHARDALRHALTACVTYKPGITLDG